MHDPSSTLTHVFSVSSFCKTYAPEGNPSLLHFPLLCENHLNDNLFYTELSKILTDLSNTIENICD